MINRPRKYFGQHFLHDDNIIEKILASIAPQTHDHFVEIGPGHGAMTRPLLARVARLDAVEVDRNLVSELRTEIDDDRLRVHCADALKFDFAALVNTGNVMRLCGNLPYNISTPLLFHLLDCPALFSDLHIMLQKEVVDRMIAVPGSRTYGRLSVAIAARCRAERLFTIRPGSFAPPPKVDSAFVRLIPDMSLRNRINDEQTFNDLIRQAFSMRRKIIANALRSMVTSDDIERLGIDPGMRPEQLTVQQYISLANELSN